MNIKLKFNLLRYWSGKINRNQGFALPIALGLGVGITLVGLSMLIKTHADQAKAYSQKQKSESLSAAEIGMTQIQSLINNNKVLIEYPSQCIVVGTNNCWANIKTTVADNTNAPDFQEELETAPNSGVCSDRTTSQIEQTLGKIRTIATSNPNDVNTWERVSGGNTGEVEYYYRLDKYEYDSTNKMGILTVEGLAKHPNATNNSSDVSESRTKLRVNVRIIKQPPLVMQRSTAPGLWITSGATDDLTAGKLGLSNTTPSATNGTYKAGSTFQGDVILSDCKMALPYYPRTLTGQTVRVSGVETRLNNSENSPARAVVNNGGLDNNISTTADNTDYKGVILKLDQPTLPDKPTFSPEMRLGNIGSVDLTLPRDSDLTASPPRYTPKTIIRTNGSGSPSPEPIQVYEYLVDSIDGNKTITIRPGYRVNLYVNGDINGTGGAEIKHDCTTAPSGTSCKPTNFQIFAYSTSTNAKICFKGNSNLEGFVLAPNYDVGVTGTGNFRGSLWAESWGKIQSCGSVNGKVAVFQAASWDDLPSIYRTANLLPQLGPVANWEQVEQEEITSSSSPSPSPSVSSSTSPSPSVSPTTSPSPSVSPTTSPSPSPSTSPSPSPSTSPGNNGNGNGNGNGNSKK